MARKRRALSDIDIRRLHAAYGDGLRPTDLVDRVHAAIDDAGDPGIFISLRDRAEARAAASALPPFLSDAMPLWGVPFAVKDNIDVAGVPTTAGCPAFAYTPQISAPVVERLFDAGAILIGKTNLDQFATGLVGTRTPYPVPRNSFDPALVPGGSSSGSAVAVARGLVSFALGTDTAGSGRVPAALNNVVGLKPSRGAISNRGTVPACRTLDCVSVFAATVDDAWTVLGVAAGYDEADPYSRPVALGGLSLPPSLRIAVPDAKSRIFGSAIAEEAFDAALALLARLGFECRTNAADLSLFFEAARLLYEGAWVGERYAAIRDFIESRPDALHPVTRQIIEGARSLSAADAFAGQIPARGADSRDGSVLARPRCSRRSLHSRHLHACRCREETDRRQFAPRRLHQLRQPARPLRARRARPVPRRRAAGGGDADCAGRPRRSARGARRAAARGGWRADRRHAKSAAADRVARRATRLVIVRGSFRPHPEGEAAGPSLEGAEEVTSE